MNRYFRLCLPHSLKSFCIHIQTNSNELVEALMLYWNPSIFICENIINSDILVNIKDLVFECFYLNKYKRISYTKLNQVMGIISTIVRNL